MAQVLRNHLPKMELLLGSNELKATSNEQKSKAFHSLLVAHCSLLKNTQTPNQLEIQA